MKQKFIFTVLALIAALGITASSHAQSAAAQKTMLQMKALGTSALTTPAPGAPVNDDNLIRQEHDTDLLSSMISSNQSAVPGPLLSVGGPGGSPIAGSNPGFSGFKGLTHLDQRNAGTGIYANTQFNNEPPDQGLAVGNGFVLEAVNDALAVYDKNGTLLKGPTAQNQFFNLAPEVKRTPPVRFGDFTTDPRCYFDRQTERWLISLLQLDVNPVTGNFSGRSHLLLAVSQTDDPTLGFNLFSIDVTNDGLNGTPSHPGCPCFGDQPLIGADSNGFYISTNEFGIPGIRRSFNGAQIYAMSKKRLAQGFLSTVVHFSGLRFPGGLAFSVQPATTRTRESEHGEESEHRGDVEFLMSTLNFSLALQNKIAVWAITDTDSLKEAVPDVELSKVVIDSEVYGAPPDATQKAGSAASRPLGTLLGEPEELLATNDHRMQQVVFADGKLWGALTTVIKQGPNCTGFNPSLPTGFGPDCFSGVAWFQVKPSIDDDTLKAKLRQQGYVSITGNFVHYPSVAVNGDGGGTIAFSLSGKDFFPSVGYVRINEDGNTGKVHVAALGAAPDDGFSGYVAFGGAGSGRWGDYSAAVADGEGKIWFAGEYIPGGPRTQLANWGTFIGHVRTDEEDDD